MAKPIKLEITPRERGSKGAMNQLRRDGFLPASMSQKGGDAVSFSLRREEFRKALVANGMSSVFKLQADRKTSYTAMVRELQRAPLSGDWLHVTFQAVSLTEETTGDIPVHVRGRDDLIHNGYELLQHLETLHLKGLPGDFPASVDVEVGAMEPGDQVTVADLKLPKGVTALTEPERLVLAVAHPKVREEEPAAAAAQETPAEEAAEPAAEEEAAPPAEEKEKGGKKGK
ncbi:MAG TPA: 50S ribosomal protein L25 [Candidatus Limnocylindria bacterium]|nr:50S ribosomal protein L25 [Candidatus Limnocylindria bacterium]